MLFSFRETKAFTRDIDELLSGDSYHALPVYLQRYHELGDVIPGGGGLRKIRWHLTGKGKRGGLRIIYYVSSEKGVIYLVAIYAKSQKADLDKDQIKVLSEYVKEWRK